MPAWNTTSSEIATGEAAGPPSCSAVQRRRPVWASNAETRPLAGPSNSGQSVAGTTPTLFETALVPSMPPRSDGTTLGA